VAIVTELPNEISMNHARRRALPRMLRADGNPRYHANQEDDNVAKGRNTRKETKKPKKDKK